MRTIYVEKLCDAYMLFHWNYGCHDEIQFAFTHYAMASMPENLRGGQWSTELYIY